MGRQIHFLMTAEDKTAFVCHMVQATGVLILPAYPKDANYSSSQNFPSSDAFGAGSMICFWNSEISDAPIIRQVKNQNYYAVDRSRSEVIEFSESTSKRPGRLWIDTQSHDDDFNPFPKSSAFLNWFESSRRWIKKHYRFDKTRDIYLSPSHHVV